MGAKKEKKKKIFYRRRFFALLIFLIIFFFLIRSVTGRFYKTYKTVFPTLTTYIKSKDVKGYNIFNEKVYYAEANGVTAFNASEGQKVPVDFKIASINLMNDTSGLKDELIKVKSALSYKKNTESEGNKESNDLINIKKLQDDIKANNYIKAIEDINNLDISSEKSISISELSDLMSYSEDALEIKKDELIGQISKSNISYNAEYSGVVTFVVDNLEKYYKFDDLSTFTYEYLNKHNKIIKNETKSKIQESDVLFKLIDNINYYIALPIKDLKEIENPEVGDYINLKYDDIFSYHKIIKINKSKNGNVLILAMNNIFNKIYKNRINDYSIILKNEKCFEIPKKTIIKRNGKFGVYVQEIHGLVKFIPIKVIHPLEESSYISKGDKNGYINIDNKSYRTITINDSIVINPKQVDESHVLN
ncbi:MAG: HlyD family efflux transporter periplasmic adaptor subunit [Peptoniphilaceae bacterium]